MEKKEIAIKLRIDSWDDRRDIVSILADNGYTVRVEKDTVQRTYLARPFWVVIEKLSEDNLLSKLKDK